METSASGLRGVREMHQSAKVYQSQQLIDVGARVTKEINDGSLA